MVFPIVVYEIKISVLFRHSVRFGIDKKLHATDSCSLIGRAVMGGITTGGDAGGSLLLLAIEELPPPPPPPPQFPAPQYPPNPAMTPTRMMIRIIDNQNAVLFLLFVAAVEVVGDATIWVKMSSVRGGSSASLGTDISFRFVQIIDLNQDDLKVSVKLILEYSLFH